MASLYEPIRERIVERIDALGLTLNGAAVTVQKRKLPTATERLDTLPLIAVCPSESPGKRTWLTFAGADGTARVRVENLVDVVLITAGNADPIANQDDYSEWMQQIARALGTPSAYEGIEGYFDVDVQPEVKIDRTAYALLYDCHALRANVVTIEPDS